MRKHGTVEDWFWKKVDKISSPDGCWVWTGSRWPNGYGSFYHTKAHRFSYELHKGPIPPGMCVCHTCDVRYCVNPDHLWLGTVTENNNDTTIKGRQYNRHGERHPLHDLNNEQVLEIRRLHATGEYVQRELADMFNTSQSNISLIIKRKHWTDI